VDLPLAILINLSVHNMKVLLETTKDWSVDCTNHIYYVTDDKSKMIAFYNVDTKKVKKFKNPISFDRRYRTFKELK
jgi:hypothetical protein